MSLSNQGGGLKNPAKKFIEFKSSKSFYYYDRDSKENVSMPNKFYIIPLDRLATVTGWHDASMSGIYSNEVHSTKNEDMSVKSFKGGDIVKGKYADIKGQLEGGKYTASVYGALINSDGSDVELVNVKFSGSGLKPLIDLDFKTDGSILELSKDPTPLKKGTNTYFAPKLIFNKDKRDDLTQKAMELDRELQEYMLEYKMGNQQTSTESAPTTKKATPDPEFTPPQEDDDLPF